MSGMKRAICLVAALAVSACSNATGWRDDGFGGSGSGGAGASADGGLGAGALAPNSPAYFQQTVGDRVLFAVDQHELGAGAQTTLAAQAGWLAANPEYTITIEGHADEQGTREYNLGLGARRANAAREYLVANGVSPTRIKTVSFGKERPLEICSAEACYAQNRRAVTVIAGGFTS
ncbi:peptidoglycan-associated lipoprotein Pal [Epibacterium ulvae]|uniref:peptidoglycan-associated lipoprotein Pal n=1 Tax=Epibacterium ulvae TaxID=1156985 RepID=UPI001BFCC9C2|nr:peptidoglycan-associated lipoprotein Pal [Epibacterium ulvae]